MERPKKNNKRMLMLSTILIVIVVVIFVYLRSRQEMKPPTKSSENKTVEKLMKLNIEEDYPQTPGAIVDLYCQISRVLYNNQCTSDEVNELIVKLREIYAQKLLDKNPIEQNMKNFKSDISKYIKDKQKISTYTVAKNEDIEISIDDTGTEYATVPVTLSMSKKSERFQVKEIFMLEKDIEGKWKILGWKLEENKQ